jgi:hypothetical protein
MGRLDPQAFEKPGVFLFGQYAAVLLFLGANPDLTGFQNLSGLQAGRNSIF